MIEKTPLDNGQIFSAAAREGSVGTRAEARVLLYGYEVSRKFPPGSEAVKILICSYEYAPVTALARQLATKHEVTVLAVRDAGTPAEANDDGARVCRVKGWPRRKSMLAFIAAGLTRGSALMRDESFDVIHTHGLMPGGIVGHLLSRFYGVPNVLSVQGSDLNGPDRGLLPHRNSLPRTLSRALLANADVLVGQSRDTLHRIREYYDVSRAVERIALSTDDAFIDSCAARYEQVFAAAIDPLSRSAHLTHPAQAA